MNLLRHPIRLSLRLFWLSAELLLAALRYVPTVAFQPANAQIHARARWLQQSCRRVLQVLHVKIEAQGPIPRDGLVVSNHLSYVDVLVLGALTPVVLVSKSEVRYWPVFGWFATKAGTIFVDRRKRMQAASASRQIKSVLAKGMTLVLFPEGTSSGGRTVLPFRSSLFEPVMGSTHALTICSLEYELSDGDACEEVCYWKDMVFLPHLLNLLTKSCIMTRIHFSQSAPAASSRKELAGRLHSEVWNLKRNEYQLSA